MPLATYKIKPAERVYEILEPELDLDQEKWLKRWRATPAKPATARIKQHACDLKVARELDENLGKDYDDFLPYLPAPNLPDVDSEAETERSEGAAPSFFPIS